MTDDRFDYDQAVEKINRPNAALYLHSEHTRFLVKLVAVALVVVMMVVAANVYFDVRINRTDSRLARQNESIYAACVARNESRASLVQAFDRFAALTSASETAIADSVAYVAIEFPQIDCGPKPL